MTHSHSYRFTRTTRFLFLLASLALGAAAQGQAIPQPQLFAVFPMGGRAGSEFEANVFGQTIDGDLRLCFSHPGITATPVMLKPDRFYPAERPAPGRFIVRVAGDVPIGAYEARVATRQGLSNARTFMVDGLAESWQPQLPADPSMARRGRRDDSLAQPPKSNADLASAMPLAVESIVNGACTAQLSDYYKFTAKKGQRLIIHCTAQEADSRADAVLDLYDAAGNHLQMRHDAVRLDPTLDFTADADGEFIVALHDFLYRGGPEFGYRLLITAGPWIDFVDPPFATPGGQEKHVLYGRNLPGSSPADVNGADGRPLEKLAVTISAPGDDAAPATDTLMRGGDASIATFSYRFESSGRTSNPVRIALVAGTRLTEEEPNNTPETAQPLTVPAQVVGRFYPRDDKDWYTFHARKGEKLWIEVISQRLGLPTDPWLMVQSQTPASPGKPVAFVDLVQADDQTVSNPGDNGRNRMSTSDPALAFTAPQEGTYRLLVRDLFGSGQAEPRFFYLLSVRAAQPDYRLIASYSRADRNDNGSNPSTAVLRKGGTVAVDVLAFRREGFEGEIELSAQGLPQGVTAEPAVIGPSINLAHLVLRAASDAAEWNGSVRIVGKAKVAGADIVRAAVINEVLNRPEQGSNFVPARISRNIALSVRGDVRMPYAIDTGEAKIRRVPRGGKLEVPVKIIGQRGKIDRSRGDRGLDLAGLPQLIRPAGGRQMSAENGNEALELNVDPTTPPGLYSFIVRGDATVSYVIDSDAAKRAEQDRTCLEALAQQAATDSQNAQAMTRRAEQALQDLKQKLTQLTQQQSNQTQLSKAADKAQQSATRKLTDAQTASDAAQKDFAAQQKSGDAKALEKVRRTADKAKAALDKATAAVAEQKKEAQASADALAKLMADTDAVATKVIPAEDELKRAQQHETAARDFTQQADAARQRVAVRIQTTAELGRPRDLRTVVCSSPIRIEVVASPFALALKGESIEVKAGGPPADLQAALKRDFGFDDEVRFDIQMPQGANGVRISENGSRIAKGKNSGALSIQADKGAAPGVFTCTLRARYQLNGRELTLETPVEVKVLPARQK